jgi:hypothetical protein
MLSARTAGCRSTVIQCRSPTFAIPSKTEGLVGHPQFRAPALAERQPGPEEKRPGAFSRPPSVRTVPTITTATARRRVPPFGAAWPLLFRSCANNVNWAVFGPFCARSTRYEALAVCSAQDLNKSDKFWKRATQPRWRELRVMPVGYDRGSGPSSARTKLQKDAPGHLRRVAEIGVSPAVRISPVGVMRLDLGRRSTVFVFSS